MTRLIVLGLFGLLMFLPTTVLSDENNISSSMKNSEETDKQRLSDVIEFNNCELLRGYFDLEIKVAKKLVGGAELFPVGNDNAQLTLLAFDCQQAKGTAFLNGKSISNVSIASFSLRVKAPPNSPNPVANHNYQLWWHVSGEDADRLVPVLKQAGAMVIKAEKFYMSGGDDFAYDPMAPRVVPDSVSGELIEQKPDIKMEWTEELNPPADHETGGGITAWHLSNCYTTVHACMEIDFIYDKHGSISLWAHPKTTFVKMLREAFEWDGQKKMHKISGVAKVHTLKTKCTFRFESRNPKNKP